VVQVFEQVPAARHLGPWICTAASTTNWALLVANSLAMAELAASHSGGAAAGSGHVSEPPGSLADRYRLTGIRRGQRRTVG
jgi:hypothetical protein